MLVSELISRLQGLPQDMEVYVKDRGFCNECNPEAMDYFTKLKEKNVELGFVGGDRYGKQKQVVVL